MNDEQYIHGTDSDEQRRLSLLNDLLNDASLKAMRLEGGEKRWIRDIATFEAEGHVWEDVRLVGCNYLRDLPDGETIPPGFGPPPQP